MALAFPALSGDGDVQTPRIDDRPGGNRQNQAFCDGFISFVIERERPDHHLLRVTFAYDGKCLVAARQIRDLRDVRFTRRDTGDRASGWHTRRCAWRCSTLRCRVIACPEFLPPLLPAAATGVVTACEDGTVAELDRIRAVCM